MFLYIGMRPETFRTTILSTVTLHLLNSDELLYDFDLSVHE